MNRYLRDLNYLKPSRYNWGRPSGYLEAPVANGVGRHVCQLQRVTFFFCRSRNDSRGIREFIESDLIDFARANPGIVVYLQPKRFVAPYIVGEHLNGRTSNLHASRLPNLEIRQWLHYLRCKSGVPVKQMLKNSSTMHPSTQGIWHPFYHQPSELNVAEFPNEQLSAAQLSEPSATDKVLQLARELKNVRLVDDDDNKSQP